jgi:hypothetical protein
MSQYGINVPPGIPVFKLDEVAPAAKKMADKDGQVSGRLPQRRPLTCPTWRFLNPMHRCQSCPAGTVFLSMRLALLGRGCISGLPTLQAVPRGLTPAS